MVPSIFGCTLRHGVSRDALRHRRRVTSQAVVVRASDVRVARRHRDGVEGRTQFRIAGRDLHQFTAPHPTDVDIVVEVNGAGVSRRNVANLHTGFGEHQGLGSDLDLQFLQQRRQVPCLGVIFQRHVAALDLRDQIRHRVVVLGLAVLDRRFFDVDLGRARRLQCEQHQKTQRTAHECRNGSEVE